MELRQIFRQFIKQHPPVQNQPWLLAVSGGVDSVILVYLCYQHQIPFAIAHCNFNLRGQESLRDKAFAEKTGSELRVPVWVKDFDTNAYMTETGKSVQEAARELRYKWFQEIAREKNYAFIATAHHADDNAETVLMHLFRGTGIKGLRGMLPVQGNIIRPLLHASRQMIEIYAKEHKLLWMEDSSNESDKYTRNYIRHHILPMMQQAIPQSHAGFEKSIGLLSEAELLYNDAIFLHKKKLVETKGNEQHIPVLKLAKLPAAKTILYEIISDYGFTAAQLDDAFKLLQAESGKYVASPTHRIIRNRAWLVIAPHQPEQAALIIIEKHQAEVIFQNGELQLHWPGPEKIIMTSDVNIALLNAVDIHFPLLLRPWRQGDYFYPLGMQKKKKLSRFFIDQKLSKTDKEKIWVIESRKKIIWIIGRRIDDRFKLEPSTRQVLQLQFKPNTGSWVNVVESGKYPTGKDG